MWLGLELQYIHSTLHFFMFWTTFEEKHEMKMIFINMTPRVIQKKKKEKEERLVLLHFKDSL